MKKQTNKTLSTLQLFAIIGSLIALGVFLLVMSGLFDQVEISAQQSNQTSNEHIHNNNVDLNAINEINQLEETVKANPSNHEALLKLGHLLNDNGFFERAIDKYDIYLNTHPNNADVIVDLGVCYFELQQFDKSIEKIKSAIDINPKHQIAHFNLGIVTLANNDMATAKEWWRKARDIDPSSNIGQKAEKLLQTNN